ncbi:MAG: hypothetical protein Q8L35_02075 [Actinomycetota bacterium]|nr:hypothetical protein [Actinomycetota bacterium]
MLFIILLFLTITKMKIKILCFIYIFMILIAIGFSRPSALMDDRQMKGWGVTYLAEIADGAKVSQTFVTKHDNLTGIAVLSQNFRHAVFGDLILTVSEVKDTANKRLVVGKELTRVIKPATGTTNNAALTFWFSPIHVKTGKTYAFTLTSTSLRGQGITVWSANSDVYRGGRGYFEYRVQTASAVVQGQGREVSRIVTEDPGDIFFITYYHKPFFAAIRGLFHAAGALPLAPIFVVIPAFLAAVCLAALALAGSIDLLVSDHPSLYP